MFFLRFLRGRPDRAALVVFCFPFALGTPETGRSSNGRPPAGSTSFSLLRGFPEAAQRCDAYRTGVSLSLPPVIAAPVTCRRSGRTKSLGGPVSRSASWRVRSLWLPLSRGGRKVSDECVCGFQGAWKSRAAGRSRSPAGNTIQLRRGSRFNNRCVRAIFSKPQFCVYAQPAG